MVSVRHSPLSVGTPSANSAGAGEAPPGPASRAPEPALGSQLTLRRWAPGNERRQMVRSVGRFVVRVLADGAALWMAREFCRLVAANALASGGAASPFAIARNADVGGWQFAVAMIVGLFVTGNYGRGDRVRDPSRLAAGAALGNALPLWGAAWSAHFGFWLLAFLLFTAVLWLALIVDRACVDYFKDRLLPTTPRLARTLVIAANDRCAASKPQCAKPWGHGLEFVGVVNGRCAGAGSAPCLGDTATLPRLIDEHRIETLIVCGHLPSAEFAGIIDTAVMTGCELLVSPIGLLRPGAAPRIQWRGGRPFLELAERRTMPRPETLVHEPHGFYVRHGKRILDIVAAALGIVLGAAPVFVAGLLMWVTSPGPWFVLQPRVGRGGRIFEIIKLRSMVRGAEKIGQARWASDRDPRITPVGLWIRRLRIDEIPQFANVLLGDMSLVGPRPERPELHDVIEDEHSDFALRLAVNPGITGLAQIEAGYADSVDGSMRKLAHDVSYIANLSFALDLSIVLATFRVVLTGRGSR